MELTNNDRQRIDEWVRNYKSATEPLTLSEKLCLRFGAEYATRYEREQKEKQSWDKMEPIQELIKLDPATRAFYEYIRSGWDTVTLFVEMTKYYRGIPENSLGNTFPNAECTELRNKEWTDILTTSELNDYAKQYWTSKLIGGVEPNLTDMFIAGFRLGVEKTKELP